ncbi:MULTISPECIES: sensor histidine kinase [Sphingobacterium]|uniref:Sensor histidine kinase n=1 Tax=Sphingobacterium populi TaxID=1812824 RepID=A0ABW5UFZ6_9SPHI|nr:histidine kinase [Sphingobacterium sp. CFCC 11742]
MIKIIYAILALIITLSTVNAQRGIDYNHNYAAGGRISMFVDSAAKNVFYANKFPNQPNVSFNYLPDIEHVCVKIYFKKSERVENYRYTILADDKPIVVNEMIDLTQLQEGDRGDEEIFDVIMLDPFPIKDKTVTILTYDVERPFDVFKNVFYGKPIPKAKIKLFGKRFATDQGVDYDHIIDPKESTNLTFDEKDDELTIVKDRSDIDYIYGISIKDKRTNKLIFESTAWQYGGTVDEAGQLLPYVVMDKSIFKKSGDYEIIIQPLIQWDNCLDCNMSAHEIEKYSSRYSLAITLNQESYTQKEMLTYTLIVAFGIGVIFLVILYFTKKRSKINLAAEEQQKNAAKLQLNAIRSQLNPHFLFNALAGIQNLMNKNETDNANKYLSKFARLTRNVLHDKELISLSEEKTLLDDYLQMEQLRFGFAYAIKHSNDLDLDNTEIPSMLLQPFVENAIKHGISNQGSAGLINIEFTKYAKDLILKVVDNGRGFDTKHKYDGLGLSLSHSRIALLNNVYKENCFTLAMQSTDNGTTISMTITDWL